MPIYKNVNGVDVLMTAEEEAEYNARVAANAAAYSEYVATEKYKDERIDNYPSIGDQLDCLWHGMDSGEIPKCTEWYNAIKAVKDAYPKPVEG